MPSHNFKSQIYQEAESVYDWALRCGADEDGAEWCAICSFELFKRFRRNNLDPLFYEVIDKSTDFAHCFIMCKGYIVDVTARQFMGSLNTINVISPPLISQLPWFWQTRRHHPDFIVHIANSTSQIKRIMKSWPTSQNPFKNYLSCWA